MSKSILHSKTFWNTVLGAVATLTVSGQVALTKDTPEAAWKELGLAALTIYTGLQATHGRVKAKERVYTPAGFPGPNREDLDLEETLEELRVTEAAKAIALSHTPTVLDPVDTADLQETLDFNITGAGSYTVEVNTTTKLKTAPVDSNVGTVDTKTIHAGERFGVDHWAFEGTDHIQVTIRGRELFLYVPHIRLENNQGQPVNIKAADPVAIVARKTAIALPTGTVYLEDPVIPGGHFFWSEVTKGGTRIPSNRAQVENIQAIARKLEPVRKAIGKPFRVNSWYRDPVSNANVGGAKRSCHLEGHAVDLVVVGMSPQALQAHLRGTWPGGLGCYPTFTHVDLGAKRRW